MLPSAALRCFEFEACTAARACVDDIAAAGCRLLTALVTASEPPCAATFFFFFLRACEGTATERFCSSIDRLKLLVALIHRSDSTASANSAPPGSAPSPGKHEACAQAGPTALDRFRLGKKFAGSSDRYALTVYIVVT